MKPYVVALDPGSDDTGYCIVNPDGRPVKHGILSNHLTRGACQGGYFNQCPMMEADVSLGNGVTVVYAIELMRGYGMTAGNEVLDTAIWTGRFAELLLNAAHTDVVHGIARTTVKRHLCDKTNANDKDIREALCDRYGGEGRAVGLKDAPGPLYKMNAHARAALAVALTVQDGAFADKWLTFQAT